MKRFRFQDVLFAVAIVVFETGSLIFVASSPQKSTGIKFSPKRCHYKVKMSFQNESLILRNYAEYLLILGRRGRSLSWLKSGDIPQDGNSSIIILLFDKYYWLQMALLTFSKLSVKVFAFFFMPRLTRLANSQNMINISIFRHFSLYRL